jgi:hypothetical protein
MRNSRIVNLSIIGLLFVIFFIISACQNVTEVTGDDYLTELPKNLDLDNSIPQNYKFALRWINRDIEGNLINNSIVTAKYTRALEDGSVRWDKVLQIDIIDSVKYEKQLTQLDGLTYKIIGDNFTKQEFYDNFPKNNIELIRWFVQDGVTIEIFAWMYFDSLRLNQTFYPEFFRNQRINIENFVNVTNQELSLTWTGVSKINNERCAVIHYQAMYNSIDANTEAMQLHGRSTYWGDIWVSLSDKQIEYAVGNEDVIFKMKTAAYGEQRINLQREVTFRKIN